jgi:hypothetical protein
VKCINNNCDIYDRYDVKNDSVITLRDMLCFFQNFPCEFVIDIKRFNKIRDADKYVINRIASGRTPKWRKDLEVEKYSVNRLLRLLFCSYDLDDWKKKCVVRGKLRRVLKNRCGMSSERIVAKLEFDERIDFGIFRDIMNDLILFLPLETEVKRKLLKESKVIHVSRKKVSDILCNHIAMAKKYTSECPSCVCGCTDGVHINGNTDSFSDDVKEILDLSGNFVPYGASEDVRRDMRAGLRDMMLKYLVPLFGLEESEIINLRKMNFYCILRNLGYDFRIVRRIFSVIDGALIKNNDNNVKRVTEYDVYKVKKKLRGFVICPKDKNVNELMVM